MTNVFKLEAGSMNMDRDSSWKLARWLRANAIFSAVSGTAIALTSGFLPEMLGVGGRALYFGLGLALVAYGIRLWLVSGRDVSRGEAMLIVSGDVLWVMGSIVLIAAGALTTTGVVLVLAVAVVIAVFAVGQWKGLPG